MADPLSPDLVPAIARLLARTVASFEFTARRLGGGANNRTWRIDAAHKSFLLKEYFHHSGDVRDRSEAECAFLTFCWERGLRCLPQPLAVDPVRQLGLMEFIDGRTLEPQEVTADRVDEAARFFRELNRHRSRPGAASLRAGAEACFSLDEHRTTVAARVERLRPIPVQTEVERDAAEWIHRRLVPAWKRIDDELRLAEAVGSEASPLATQDRCLSPSDFGFHNAILAGGRLRFHDFEYAGWDDPARMLCDFFLQVHRPAAFEHWDAFAEAACGEFREFPSLLERARRLLPLYRIKWCCLLLNEFLPAAARRRAFAGRSVTESDKARQLALAEALLGRDLSAVAGRT